MHSLKDLNCKSSMEARLPSFKIQKISFRYHAKFERSKLLKLNGVYRNHRAKFSWTDKHSSVHKLAFFMPVKNQKKTTQTFLVRLLSLLHNLFTKHSSTCTPVHTTSFSFLTAHTLTRALQSFP